MTFGRLSLQNIRDSLDSDIQIYMKLKEKIMEKAKTKENKFTFLKRTVGVRFICYNTDIKQEQEGTWETQR